MQYLLRPPQLPTRLRGREGTAIEVGEVVDLGEDEVDHSMMCEMEGKDNPNRIVEDGVAAEAEIEGRLAWKSTRIPRAVWTGYRCHRRRSYLLSKETRKKVRGKLKQKCASFARRLLSTIPLRRAITGLVIFAHCG